MTKITYIYVAVKRDEKRIGDVFTPKLLNLDDCTVMSIPDPQPVRIIGIQRRPKCRYDVAVCRPEQARPAS